MSDGNGATARPRWRLPRASPPGPGLVLSSTSDPPAPSDLVNRPYPSQGFLPAPEPARLRPEAQGPPSTLASGGEAVFAHSLFSAAGPPLLPPPDVRHAERHALGELSANLSCEFMTRAPQPGRVIIWQRGPRRGGARIPRRSRPGCLPRGRTQPSQLQAAPWEGEGTSRDSRSQDPALLQLLPTPCP